MSPISKKKRKKVDFSPQHICVISVMRKRLFYKAVHGFFLSYRFQNAAGFELPPGKEGTSYHNQSA